MAVDAGFWPGLLTGALALPPAELALAMAAVFAGYVVLGLTGFGSALVAVPLLAWLWPLSWVVPLVLLIDVPSLLLHTWLNRRDVAWGEVPRLVPWVLLGAALGMLLVRHAPAALLLSALGLYVVAVGWRGWRGTRPPKPAPPGAAWIAGLAIGVVESLYGTAGPVVMAWLQRRLSDARVLRATLPAVFLLMVAAALAAAAWAGAFAQPALWPRLLPLVLASVVGVWIGHHGAARVSQDRLLRLTYGLLIASGLTMLWRAATLGG